MSKEKESQVPIVGIGTTFDVSGHQAKCVAITKNGIKIVLPDSTDSLTVEFKQIEQAVFGNK
jgi:Flp pilus assembly protein CpaB